MIGNPYKAPTQDPILEDTANNLVIPANGVATVNYTVPQGRGKVQAVAIFLDNNTPADMSGGSITISASGKSLFNKSPLLKHSALYNSARKPTIGQIDEQVPVTISAVGGPNVAITAQVVFYYYDTIMTTLANSVMQTPNGQ